MIPDDYITIPTVLRHTNRLDDGNIPDSALPHPLTRISAPEKQYPPSPTGQELAPRRPSPRRHSRSSYLSWTSAFRDSITSSEDQPASPERGWLLYLSSPLTPIWAWARGRGYRLDDLDGGYARALTREVAINIILGRDAGGKAQHRTECQRDGCEHDC
jgi:hypothetical protein